MVKQLLRLVLVINVGLETYRYIHKYTVLILRKSLFLEKVKKIDCTGTWYWWYVPGRHSILLSRYTALTATQTMFAAALQRCHRLTYTTSHSSYSSRKRKVSRQARRQSVLFFKIETFHIFRSQQQNIDA